MAFAEEMARFRCVSDGSAKHQVPLAEEANKRSIIDLEQDEPQCLNYVDPLSTSPPAIESTENPRSSTVSTQSRHHGTQREIAPDVVRTCDTSSQTTESATSQRSPKTPKSFSQTTALCEERITSHFNLSGILCIDPAKRFLLTPEPSILPPKRLLSYSVYMTWDEPTVNSKYAIFCQNGKQKTVEEQRSNIRDASRVFDFFRIRNTWKPEDLCRRREQFNLFLKYSISFFTNLQTGKYC
jgi:hypothetical protein